MMFTIGFFVGLFVAGLFIIFLYKYFYKDFISRLLQVLNSSGSESFEIIKKTPKRNFWGIQKVIGRKQDFVYSKVSSILELNSDAFQKIKFNLVQQNSTLDSMFEFTENFEKVSQNQSLATEDVAANTEELQASFDSINSIAEKQVKHLEIVSSDLDGFTIFMETLSKEISKISSESKKFTLRIQDGKNVVLSANQAMSNIAESSSKIKEIAVNINEISEQTNLLALNASIEAARAGEYGRGFAVVADEIYKLSERTVVSVKEIENFVRNTSREVRTGVETLRLTSEIIRDMLTWTEKLDIFMNRFSEDIILKTISSKEIADGLEQVRLEALEIKNASIEQTEAVSDISSKTQHISQESESILMSSMELGALVDELKRITTTVRATMD